MAKTLHSEIKPLVLGAKISVSPYAKAKAKGVYEGTKKRIDREKVHQLKVEGYSTYKIAEKMGISRMSVHRILNTEAA